MSQGNAILPQSAADVLLAPLGKYDYVKYVLSLVLRYARLMADANREMKDIPVPLWKLFATDADQKESADQDELYDQLFGSDGSDDKPRAEGDFSVQDSDALLELLTTVPLPNIDSNEQLILMAVIDTVKQGEQQSRSLDENGIRYLLYLRLSLSLTKVSPTPSRPTQMQPVDIFWAYHSESQVGARAGKRFS